MANAIKLFSVGNMHGDISRRHEKSPNKESSNEISLNEKSPKVLNLKIQVRVVLTAHHKHRVLRT